MKKSRKKAILWTISTIVFVSLIAFTAIPCFIMKSMLGMHVDFNQTFTPDQFGLEAEHFFVKTEDGLDISAWEVTTDAPKAVVICLSGMHGPSATVYFGHAKLFREHGFATILLDMRAHGESDGDKISVGYKEWRDVEAAVAYIKEKPLYDGVPIVAFGVSMGAATAINAAGEVDDIDAVISLSAFSSCEEVFCDNMRTQVPRIIAEIERPFVHLASYFFFGAESRRIKPRLEIEKLGERPILLMHSKDDTQVPFGSFEKLKALAPAHTQTFVREGDLHFITEHFANPEEDAEYTGTIIGFINNML